MADDPNKGTVHLAVERRMKAEGSAPSNKMASAPENKSLSSMTKAELIATAEAEGVDLSDASNNDERVAAIEKARKG